jgi:hypothetical protein
MTKLRGIVAGAALFIGLGSSPPQQQRDGPMAANVPSVALNTIRLTSMRVGSRATCSLRNGSSRSPIREATTPMPVAPPVTPVVAVPAPPAALGYQFDGRHDAQRARLG